MACQSPCRLRIFGCRRIESDTSRLEGIKGASVGLPVPAIELDRIHVAPGQLGRLRSASVFAASSELKFRRWRRPPR